MCSINIINNITIPNTTVKQADLGEDHFLLYTKICENFLYMNPVSWYGSCTYFMHITQIDTILIAQKFPILQNSILGYYMDLSAANVWVLDIFIIAVKI